MSYKKLEDIRHQDFGKLPDYIVKEKSLEKIRMTYRVKTKMINDIKVLFKNSHKSRLQCDWCDCGEDESQRHITHCKGWEDKRTGLDLENIMDRVELFRRILDKKRGEGLL